MPISSPENGRSFCRSISGYRLRAGAIGRWQASIANRTFEKAYHIAQTLKNHTDLCLRLHQWGGPTFPGGRTGGSGHSVQRTGHVRFRADYDDLSFLQALPNMPVMEAIVNPPRTRSARRSGGTSHRDGDGCWFQMGNLDLWFGIQINEQRSACASRCSTWLLKPECHKLFPGQMIAFAADKQLNPSGSKDTTAR